MSKTTTVRRSQSFREIRGMPRPALAGAILAERETDPRMEILNAAAHCFTSQGFAATSIDDVARKLNATKGMIYHHFRSKNDLFFAVYRRGMDINFEAIKPFQKKKAPALTRLARIGYAHAVTMMAEQDFQRTVSQGVVMHQTGSTTAAQRETLEELIEVRDRYEAVFREAIRDAAREEKLDIGDLSIAVKCFLAALNGTVFWYSPRQKNPQEEQHKIALNLITYALRGLGAELPQNAIHNLGEDQ